MEYRINGFEQIKSFYSWVFNNPDKIRPTHISLYLFLLNQNNRSNWVEWFKCPYDLAMQGACIGNNGTYYRCLDDLKEWKLIDYQKGINNYKAPLVKLFQLYDSEQVTVPLSEQQCVQLTEQVSEQQCVQLTEQVSEQQCVQLPAHIYKLITDNTETINQQQKQFELLLTKFFNPKIKPVIPEWKTSFDVYKKELNIALNEMIIDREWMKEKEKFNPSLDIKLTLNKAYSEFWGTEAGWMYKKKEKIEKIDWKRTMVNAISQKQNKVYKQNG
jgi:hypothetical protein